VQSWIEVFGRLHPLIVHLPIGFLLALAILEGVAYSQRASLPRGTVSVLAWLAALSAAFASLTGWALSREDGYGTETVVLHLRLGVAVAVLSVALAIAHLKASEGTRDGGLKTYRVLLGLAVLLLLPTGHLGGEIARGEGYLTAPLREPRHPREKAAPKDGVLAAEPATKVEASAAPAEAEPPSFTREIAPILAARCASCHGEAKRKGRLSLAEPGLIVDGGRNGVVVVPGKPAASELMRRIRLPADEEDHMPPAEKPQPTEAEVARIEAWIAAGAEFDVPGAPGWGSAGGTGPAGAEAGFAGGDAPGVRAADPAAIEALRAELVHVEPIARDSGLLLVSFAAAAKEIGDREAKALLEPVLEQVAELTLARSRIGDATMALAARMPNLTRLDVRDTEVGDAGVAALAGHARLAELVLVRTQLSDAAAESLLAIPELEKVYVWNSGLSVQALGRLRALRPDLVIEAGAASDARAIETEGEVVLTKKTSTASSQATGGSAAPVNATCPVSGKAVDPAVQITFKGKVVGFCCSKCASSFLADPAKYESKLP